MNKKITKGKETLEFLFGIEACDKITKRLDKDKPGYTDYMFYSYGDFYSDTTIDLKIKQLVTVAALVTQKGALPQLRGHLRGCKQAGLSKQEVCAAISHLTMYIGFPSVVNALMVVEEVFEN